MTSLRTLPHALVSIIKAATSILLVLMLLLTVQAPSAAQSEAPSSATATKATIGTTPNANLHQEVNALLAENTRINQEKKSLLESDAQKVFWTQCLVGFMIFFMVVSLFSFWRLHAKSAFNNSLSELTTGLRQFQDSILSLIDTRQLAHNSVVSSFHSSVMEQGPDSLQAHTTTKSKLNPNTEQEMSEVRNFVDAWLNIYTPGESAHDQYLEMTKNRPQSPLPLLSKIKDSRQSNDQLSFDSVRREIKKLFNIHIPSWNETMEVGNKQIADYPHVHNKIIELWQSDSIAPYLERLLANSRINGRQGFDIELYQNLENLLQLARQADRPRQLDQLKKLPLAAFLFAAPTVSPAIPATANLAPKPKVSSSQVVTADLESATPLSQLKESTSPVIPSEENLAEEIAFQAVPASAHANATAKAIPVEPISDEKSLPLADDKSSLPVYEVRLKLALAYIEMADSEGACLLLEDVIKDAPEDQKGYARELLNSLKEKLAAT